MSYNNKRAPNYRQQKNQREAPSQATGKSFFEQLREELEALGASEEIIKVARTYCAQSFQNGQNMQGSERSTRRNGYEPRYIREGFFTRLFGGNRKYKNYY